MSMRHTIKHGVGSTGHHRHTQPGRHISAAARASMTGKPHPHKGHKGPHHGAPHHTSGGHGHHTKHP